MPEHPFWNEDMRACWCKNLDFNEFSQEYQQCKVCGTLVDIKGIPDEHLRVKNDETDFYGKEYWLSHQNQDLNFPDIYGRSRFDLTERNLHWLKVFLKYQNSPAKVLELGCSHGSFVALLRQIGYDAQGVELSPWVVDFAKKTFNVPVLLGPVENIDLPSSSFDSIILMDVLEHLPDPVSTIAHCMKLLKPEGFLLIQTPQFKEGMQYQEMVENKHPFLGMLQPDEHIYLFTEDSVTKLMTQLDAKHVYFEPAIFNQYDMLFLVSKEPLNQIAPEIIQSTLEGSPNGRIALALLDLRERELKLSQLLNESELDRAARLDQIILLTTELKKYLERRLKLRHIFLLISNSICGIKKWVKNLCQKTEKSS